MSESITKLGWHRPGMSFGLLALKIFDAYPYFWEAFRYVQEKTFDFGGWYVSSDYHMRIFLGPITEETVKGVIIPQLVLWDATRVCALEAVEERDELMVTFSLTNEEIELVRNVGAGRYEE